MYSVHLTKKACIYCAIGFIISGILYVQAVKADEAEDDLIRDKIVKFLEKIPEYSGNLYIGPLSIYPSLEISETYDDNVLNSTSRDIMPHSDFYETYKPKISLALPIRDHSFAFDYGFEIFDYHDDYKLRAVQQDHVNRNFGGSVNLNFANGFSIRLSDRVGIRRNPGRFTRRLDERVLFPGDDVVEEDEILERFIFNTFTRRREFTNNIASIEINLPDFFDKLDFNITYSNIDISYKGMEFNNSERNTNILKGTVIIKPLPRINITTGYEYQDIRYDSALSSDSSYKRIPFNISWQPTVKSTFFLNTRYNRRDYGRRAPWKNYTSYDATLGYRFNVTERDNLTVKFERSLKAQQFQLDHRPWLYTQIDMDWIHSFPRNFSFEFSPAFQHLKFREKQLVTVAPGGIEFFGKRQKIDSIRLEISGRYDAPGGWLFGEISYNYRWRNSNSPSGDLVKNVGKISVGLKF